MNKKEVLIVTYSYAPSNSPAAQRPFTIAKYLDKSKYNVTVLTCDNQDSPLGFNKAVDIELPGVSLEKVKALKISRFRKSKREMMSGGSSTTITKNTLKSKVLKILSSLLVPDKGIIWWPYIIPYVLKHRGRLRPDIVLSTSPLFSNHLIARLFIRKKFENKHFADCRDYHYVINDLNQKGIRGWFQKKIEGHIVKKATIVSVISNTMREIYAGHHKLYANKFKAIYNGFDPDEFPEPQKLSPSQKLTFFYAGTFYGGLRTPKSLLTILDHLIDKSLINPSEFTIDIAGNYESKISDDLKHLKSFKNLNFLGTLPRTEVFRRSCNAHVLYLLVMDIRKHSSGVPLKFYEYLASQRPILSFSTPKSESSQLIKTLNCGWRLNDTLVDFDHQVKVIHDIFKQYREGVLNEPTRFDNIEPYTRVYQTKQFEKLFDTA